MLPSELAPRTFSSPAVPALLCLTLPVLITSWAGPVAGWWSAAASLAAFGGVCMLGRQHWFGRQRREHQERAELEARAHEAEVNYRSIFENAAQGIFQSTPEGSFITANPALARIYGVESPQALISEMSGWPAQHFFVDPVRWAEMIRHVMNQESVGGFEAEVERRDGRTVWISQDVHAVRDENDELLYLEGTIFDITDRRWAERRRALRYSAATIFEECASMAEARPRILRAVCELLDWEMGAVWEVAPEENQLRCVEVWHRQGIDIAEFEQALHTVTISPGIRLAGKVWQSGKPDWVVHFSEEAFSLNAMVAARYGMHSAFGIPVKVGGEVLHVLEFFSPKASEPDPELLGTLGLVADLLGHLMERKQAQETLRETVIRKSAILESALDSVITFDAEGRVIEWNPAAERVFGHRRADALGALIHELILPEQARHSPAHGLPLYQAGSGFGRRSTLTVRRADGREFPAEIAIARATLHGRPLFTAHLRDISELQEAEWHRGELEALLQCQPGVLFTTTLEGRIVSWNRAARERLGYSSREMTGQPVERILARESFDALAGKLTAEAPEGGAIECTLHHRTGERVPLILKVLPIRQPRGTLHGFLFHSLENPGTQEQRELVQSQKMEAVGRLAGGVAHDFNNILTAILGNTDLILPRAEAGGAVHEGLREIRKAAEFASSLTHQLLSFSRGQAMELQVLDLNELVEEMTPLLRRLISDPVQIETALAATPVPVMGDKGELEQVILNLALNARDAMPSGGVLTIETGLHSSGAGTGDSPAGDWARLVVRDTGVGMSEAVLKHVFEPFFTTKTRGRGTGLGLATCYGVVTHSGGTISCQSAPGLGTRFQLLFPRVAEPLEPTGPSAETPTATAPGDEVILLLEDDRCARALTADILRHSGYQVIEAETPEGARAMVTQYEEIRLVLADPVGSDGHWLARWLQEKHPRIRLLLTSAEPGEEPGTDYLRKPFTPFALLHKVREILGRR